MFDAIAGNDKIKNFLSRLIKTKKIPHSLLFAGPLEANKEAFAEIFSKHLAGTEKKQHADIIHYKPEGKMGVHSIQSMRELSEAVYLAPFEGERKVFIIHDAHRMLAYSANALLKTFEEPSLDSVIILLSDSPEKLLPTILSRCQLLRFQAVSNKEIPEEKLLKHPLREPLLEALSNDFLNSYPKIVEIAKEFSAFIESELEEYEKSLQKELLKAFSDTPTAHQKQMMEKEIEGMVSMKKNSEGKSLFETFLSWYRDLELLRVSGNPEYLINIDYQAKLANKAKKREEASLKKVERAVSEAILALERSTSLNICFENLFLKLL